MTTAESATDDTYVGRRVVLTREEGKNGDMRERLSVRGIEVVEMPLIETSVGPDRDLLTSALADPQGWDWVCITSPEAASVFLQGWHEAGEPDVPIATVGIGTAKIFKLQYESGALTKQTFTPSKADAKTFVLELPVTENARVLYPASLKAASTLQDGLQKRNAKVTRLNTYSTEKVTSVDSEIMALAKKADVVTFGSPSAVKAWLSLSGFGDDIGDASEEKMKHPLYACIGGTSAKACDKVGLPGVLFPDSPGLDGWERVVLTALDSLEKK
jgi:uroporphyrinogen-III synthase